MGYLFNTNIVKQEKPWSVISESLDLSKFSNKEISSRKLTSDDVDRDEELKCRNLDGYCSKFRLKVKRRLCE